MGIAAAAAETLMKSRRVICSAIAAPLVGACESGAETGSAPDYGFFGPIVSWSTTLRTPSTSLASETARALAAADSTVPFRVTT